MKDGLGWIGEGANQASEQIHGLTGSLLPAAQAASTFSDNQEQVLKLSKKQIDDAKNQLNSLDDLVSKSRAVSDAFASGAKTAADLKIMKYSGDLKQIIETFEKGEINAKEAAEEVAKLTQDMESLSRQRGVSDDAIAQLETLTNWANSATGAFLNLIAAMSKASSATFVPPDSQIGFAEYTEKAKAVKSEIEKLYSKTNDGQRQQLEKNIKDAADRLKFYRDDSVYQAQAKAVLDAAEKDLKDFASRANHVRSGASNAAAKAAREAAKDEKDRTKHLQEQLDFYKELREVMPLAGAQYEAIRKQVLDLEEAQYRAIGIGQQYLDVWREWQTLRDATDFMSGLKVAMHDYIAELTPAKAAHDLFTTTTEALSTALFDTATRAKSVGEAFQEMGQTIVNEILRITIQMAVIKPIVEGFMGLFGGGGGSGSGTLGAVTGLVGKVIPGLKLANGGVFDSPGLSAYKNTVVSKPTTFPFARGIGLMGEAGAEAIMPLERDSRGRLGVIMADGYRNSPAVQVVNNIKVVNQTGALVKAEVQSQPNGNGGSDILVKLIEDKVASNITQGKSSIDRARKGKYGMNDARSAHFG
jgi:lambda family phage tail tape measure protein